MTLLNLRRSRWARCGFGVLALLVFGFRALIPTGFMLAAVDGHTRLVICPAGVYPATGMHHAAGADHMPGMAHGAHDSYSANQCPFALATGAGLRAALHEPAEPYFTVLRSVRAATVGAAPVARPWRHHAPRGPPSPA